MIKHIRMADASSILAFLALAVVGLLVSIQPSSGNPKSLAYATKTTVPVPITEEKIDNKVYQVSHIFINVKPEQVWQILTDYKNAQYIFPCLIKCRVLEDKGTTKIVEHEIHPSGIPDTFDYVLEIKEVANHLQQWHRLSGDFHDVRGFWKLEPSDNGTLVTYASCLDGGFFMPDFLIKHQMRIDIPAVVTALKRHAEASRFIAEENKNER